MAIDKLESRSVKELLAALEPGESFLVEEVVRTPEFPNIPPETARMRVVKTSETDVRIDRWD